jgi:hypothetical protein
LPGQLDECLDVGKYGKGIMHFKKDCGDIVKLCHVLYLWLFTIAADLSFTRKSAMSCRSNSFVDWAYGRFTTLSPPV